MRVEKRCKDCCFYPRKIEDLKVQCDECLNFDKWQGLYYTKEDDSTGTASDATHYQGRIQPIESMQSVMQEPQFLGYLQGNIIKYASRLGKKGPALTDARKIRQYAEWLVQAIEGKTIDPRT